MSSEQHLRRRAVLVAPGSDERKAGKALASTTDEIVLDLEDAVTATLDGRMLDEAVAARRILSKIGA